MAKPRKQGPADDAARFSPDLEQRQAWREAFLQRYLIAGGFNPGVDQAKPANDTMMGRARRLSEERYITIGEPPRLGGLLRYAPPQAPKLDPSARAILRHYNDDLSLVMGIAVKGRKASLSDLSRPEDVERYDEASLQEREQAVLAMAELADWANDIMTDPAISAEITRSHYVHNKSAELPLDDLALEKELEQDRDALRKLVVGMYQMPTQSGRQIDSFIEGRGFVPTMRMALMQPMMFGPLKGMTPFAPYSTEHHVKAMATLEQAVENFNAYTQKESRFEAAKQAVKEAGIDDISVDHRLLRFEALAVRLGYSVEKDNRLQKAEAEITKQRRQAAADQALGITPTDPPREPPQPPPSSGPAKP